MAIPTATAANSLHQTHTLTRGHLPPEHSEYDYTVSGTSCRRIPPKFKSSSRERLRAGGDSGVPSEDDDDDDDPCISRSSPECHGTECDHGAEGGHDHFHLRGGSSSSGDFRSKSSLRNDRYKCFGLLESNILNSFQLQNFRRKNGSEYDSANSTGVFGSSKKFNSMVIPHFSPWRPPRTG
ncbi:hypothetical protein quinque_016223 [Culex quinquefasciatus]